MTRVKICGLMNLEDVELCVRAGVHCIGVVVDYPVPAPWNLTPAEGRRLLDRVPPSVTSCMVTGGSAAEILATAEAVRPDIIQLHHQETLQETDYIASQLGLMGIKTVKALRIDSGGQCAFEITDPARAAKALSQTGITALLVDSYTTVRPGGTGVMVDLSTFNLVRQASTVPVILAGGLNPGNVGQIVQVARPYAVDVLSGVEAEPGRKDHDKIYRFMQAVRG